MKTQGYWSIPGFLGKTLLCVGLLPHLFFLHSSAQRLNINLSKNSLDLNKKDSIIYKFYLPSETQTTIKCTNIYGGEKILVETNKTRVKGWHSVMIHADSLKRRNGNVTSGVYYIEVLGIKNGSTLFSFNSFQSPWGNTISANDIQFDKGSGNISFSLTESCIVKTRIGYANGALVRTLYHGLPKTSGLHSTHWDGLDQSGKINIKQLNEISAQVIAYTIPKTAFILENSQSPLKLNAKPSFPDTYTKYALSSYARIPYNDDFDVVVNYNVNMLDSNMLNLSFGGQAQSFSNTFSPENEIYIYVEGATPVENPNVAVPGDYTIAFSQIPPGKHLVLVNIILPNNRVAVGIKELTIE